MKARLTPDVIQKLYGKYLTLADAQCLFDLFTNQAVQSQWLDSRTVACWMFKTNAPTGFQLQRAKSVLHKLSSYAFGSHNKASFLDMKIESLESGYGSIIVKPAYRLSSSITREYQGENCYT